MMKQLFFGLFLATVVLMVSATEVAEDKAVAGADKAVAGAGGAQPENNGASMTTLATASLIGLAFNILMNFWQ